MSRSRNGGARQPQLKTDEVREIFQACEEFDVPQWENRKKSKKCCHCNGSLRKHLLHNCRLCGEVKCQDCTGKFYVPARFRKKGKSGPVRICWECFDACEEVMSRLSTAYVSRRKRDLQRIKPVYNEICMFPPRAWRHPDTKGQRMCFSCEMTTGGSSSWCNCRLCGEIHCKSCSLKMDGVPVGYRRKGKTGPVRVCLQCRYNVIGGMKMFELRDMPVDSDQPASAVVDPEDCLEVCIYTMRNDSPDNRLVGVVRVPKQSTPMGVGAFFSQLHEEFIHSFPRFATVKFHYLVDDRPIFPEHYDMLLCPPNVTIVPGIPGSSSEQSRRTSMVSQSSAGSNTGQETQATPTDSSSRSSQQSAGQQPHQHPSDGPATPMDGPSPTVSPIAGSDHNGSTAYSEYDQAPVSVSQRRIGSTGRDASKRFQVMVDQRAQESTTNLVVFRRKNRRANSSSSNLPQMMPTPLPGMSDPPKQNSGSLSGPPVSAVKTKQPRRVPSIPEMPAQSAPSAPVSREHSLNKPAANQNARSELDLVTPKHKLYRNDSAPVRSQNDENRDRVSNRARGMGGFSYV